jgi:hypothetical protein
MFWILIPLLIMSEMIGFFARSVRWRFRLYAGLVVLMLGVWYASETANHVSLTVPDFTPWTHFMPTQSANAQNGG